VMRGNRHYHSGMLSAMHATHPTTTGTFSLPDSPHQHSEFAMLFSSTPRGARMARLLTVRQLDVWGIPTGSQDSDTIALLVAELATNAVRHGRVAGRNFRLAVTLDARLVRIAVTDAQAESRPVLSHTNSVATSGRGLCLVDALATRWGVGEGELGAVGKTVWCEYELDS
jgi:anti-sigma regulatory factor (Ser/Thr protein kinase)